MNYLIVSIALCVAAIAATRSVPQLAKRRVGWIALALACVGSTLVFGVGFVIQPIISELLSPAQARMGHVYHFEFMPKTMIIASLYQLAIGGFLPGTLLAIALTHWPKKPTIIVAAVLGILVLVLTDILGQVSWAATAAGGEPDGPPDTLAFSIMCDLAGGPFAGILCRWICLESRLIGKAQKVGAATLRAVRTGALALASLTVLVVAFYVVFVRPVATETIVKINKYSALLLEYSIDKAEPSMIVPKGTLVEQLQQGKSWDLTSGKFSVSALGDQSSTLNLTVHGTNGPIKVRVSGALGCESPEQVLEAIHSRPDLGKDVDVSDATLSFAGNSQSLLVKADTPGTVAHVVLRDGTWLNISPAKKANERQIVPFGPATLEVPLEQLPTLVFEGLPMLFQNFGRPGKMPNRLGDLSPTALKISNGKRQQAFSLSRHSMSSEACRPVQFVTAAAHEGNLDDPPMFGKGSIVVEVVSAPRDARISANLEGLFLGVGRTETSIATEYVRQKVSLFQARALSGEMSIGTERFTLAPDDHVVTSGDPMDLAENDQGEITLTGINRYLFLNGALLNKSMWAALDGTTQSILIGAFTAAVGLLWRKRLSQLFHKAIR